MATISPKKNDVKQKRGEVIRLIELMKSLKMQASDLSIVTKVSKRTIENTIWNDEEIGGRLLRSLHQNLGVSLDWLLVGVGSMFVKKSVESMAVNNENKTLITGNANQAINTIDNRIMNVHEETKKYLFHNDNDHEEVRPLIQFYEHYDAKSMQDFWWLSAMIAEKSLLQSGAVPDRDYSRLDLYKLAQPFVLERFKDGKLNLQVSE